VLKYAVPSEPGHGISAVSKTRPAGGQGLEVID